MHGWEPAKDRQIQRNSSVVGCVKEVGTAMTSWLWKKSESCFNAHLLLASYDRLMSFHSDETLLSLCLSTPVRMIAFFFFSDLAAKPNCMQTVLSTALLCSSMLHIWAVLFRIMKSAVWPDCRIDSFKVIASWLYVSTWPKFYIIYLNWSVNIFYRLEKEFDLQRLQASLSITSYTLYLISNDMYEIKRTEISTSYIASED